MEGPFYYQGRAAEESARLANMVRVAGPLLLLPLVASFILIFPNWRCLVSVIAIDAIVALTALDDCPYNTKGKVVRGLLVPFVVANAVAAALAAVCYLQFVPQAEKTLVLCESSTFSDLLYFDPNGRRYALTEQAYQELAGSPTNSKVRAEVTGRLWGVPTIVSARRISDASEACGMVMVV